MNFKLAALVVPFLLLPALPGSAQDAMMSSMPPADPMAVECMANAAMETDAMKMGSMAEECRTMYPDSVAAMAHDCMQQAAMEANAMKKDEMTASCAMLYPDAMGGAMAPAM